MINSDDLLSYEEFQEDMRRLQKWDSFFEVSFWVFAICAPMGLILFLVSCAPTSTKDPDFIGRWAADSAGPGLVVMQFDADHSARLSGFSGAVLVIDARGTWEYEPPRLIVRHAQCQEGEPLRLIACPSPDTLRAADIIGDSWHVGMIDSGSILDFNFRKVQ